MQPTEAQQCRPNLKRCVGQIQDWCASKWLQLNSGKFKVIWFELKANFIKLKADKLFLKLGSDELSHQLHYQILVSGG